jgi:choice-of-anchor A domain-containing protein
MRLRFIAVIVLALLVGSYAPSARASDLGDALSFVLLSTGGKIIMNKKSQAGLGGNGSDQGAVGGISAILKKDSQVLNDVVTSPKGIVLHRNAEAFGCITSGASVKLHHGADCVDILDTSGTSPELATLAGGIGGTIVFEGVVKAQTPTQTLPATVVKANDSLTINTTQAGLNIVSMPSLTLKKKAVLQFSGQAGDTVIVVIDHNLKWGAGAFMTSSVDDVLFMVAGKMVSLGRNAQLEGTILAPDAKCSIGRNAQVVGAVLCGKKISLATKSQVIFAPTTITVP